MEGKGEKDERGKGRGRRKKYGREGGEGRHMEGKEEKEGRWKGMGEVRLMASVAGRYSGRVGRKILRWAGGEELRGGEKRNTVAMNPATF